jgi:hypothetical protein
VLGIVVCLLVVLAVASAIGIVTLLKAGVIVRQAAKPTERDFGSYSLEQGREVRPELERHEERR